MEQSGHKCLGYVECDPRCEKCKKFTKHKPSKKHNYTICMECGKEKRQHARFSYESIHNAKGEWTAYDITTVTNDDLRLLRGQVDVICGGFPCQAFSIAGKRLGFAETRGTLFFEIARFAKEIQPRYLFLENVKGLLSHEKGNTFATILSTLDELGYDAEWQTFNSKDIGEIPVPQKRERTFIIGHSRRYSRHEIFPIRTRETEVFVPCLKSENTLLIRENTKKGFVIAQPGDGLRLDHPNSTTGRGRIQKQLAPTLTTACNVGVILDDLSIRKITSREAWRIQGFPDWAYDRAKEVNSEVQLYKQAGNSVSIPVIYEIAKRLV
ncbi:DNA methyltransferase [Bacillus thuringiensis]|nr:Modification methylase SsoII [Bacillus thuringiensis serovar indiana]MBG9644299.1 DNA methyltransferase [Bacillus thuringiensis]MBG9649603.1 DNA methyltransferase [Bacillus thuringiensis]MRB42478.1 DNA (cytosine-5-)-methyltransferase [Bacillus thuringiensis]MRB84167.1 DNA (cytosine-5-)-methyltransferase [Bacillus thuringiensis]